jgi:hypothetical protein
LLNFEEGCSASGQLFFVVRRRGVIIDSFDESNMIMTLGRVAIARLFSGLSGGNGLYVGVGEDDTPPNAEQTELQNQALVQASLVQFAKAQVNDGITSWIPANEPTPNVRFDFVFGAGDANGMSIREFGLFTSDGTMFARRVRTSGRAIEKDEDLVIEGYWIIRF